MSFIRDELALMHDALSDKQSGETAAGAEFLRDEVHQAFRDLYRAAPQASDVEIAAQIEPGNADKHE